MAGLIRSSGSTRYRRRDGFILMEWLFAAAVLLIIWTAFVPTVLQAVKVYESGSQWEELLRQGMAVEDSLYESLRYGKIKSVSSNRIVLEMNNGVSSGILVERRRVFRLLSNGTRQPYMGSDGDQQLITVRPCGSQPYFHRDGKIIRVAMRFVHEPTGKSWPCVLSVVPLREVWSYE